MPDGSSHLFAVPVLIIALCHPPHHWLKLRQEDNRHICYLQAEPVAPLKKTPLTWKEGQYEYKKAHGNIWKALFIRLNHY